MHRKLSKILNRYFLFDNSGNYKDTILLASMGRSGSTWLSNIINYSNRYRTIFEPFYPEKVKEASPFVYPLYLRPEQDDPSFHYPAEYFLSGRIRNAWVDGQNKQYFPKKRLVKSIRANLFLKWLHINFPEIPIILLLRHPCAVVHSWIKSGFGDGYLARKRILAQQKLIDDYLEPYLQQYQNAKNAVECLTFFWCIYYYIPFKQFAPGEIHIAYYELLVEKPKDELMRLFSFLDEPFDERYLNALHVPSHTTRKDSSLRKDSVIINEWKQQFSAIQIKRIDQILSLFGLDSIYSENSIPDIQKVYQLMQIESV